MQFSPIYLVAHIALQWLVSVCVWKRVRERKREREKATHTDTHEHSVLNPHTYLIVSRASNNVSAVRRERSSRSLLVVLDYIPIAEVEPGEFYTGSTELCVPESHTPLHSFTMGAKEYNSLVLTYSTCLYRYIFYIKYFSSVTHISTAGSFIDNNGYEYFILFFLISAL